ncbi:MAG: VOC family protein [Chloroflexi bacterium]|nr:VOC family protein [Chloroflexota bacterium]
MTSVRYLVNDVNEAVSFYTDLLGFTVSERFGSAMAIVARGDLVLWLAGPRASAARPMPDGRKPEPGGWNRIVVDVDEIGAAVDRLRAAGARFRNDVIKGPGGQQILIEDPSGNPIELFQAG